MLAKRSSGVFSMPRYTHAILRKSELLYVVKHASYIGIGDLEITRHPGAIARTVLYRSLSKTQTSKPRNNQQKLQTRHIRDPKMMTLLLGRHSPRPGVRSPRPGVRRRRQAVLRHRVARVRSEDPRETHPQYKGHEAFWE